MRLWVIVPVKPFAEAKARLSGVLSDPERYALARGMLERTLDVVAGAGDVARALVVSRDPEALALARAMRADAIREEGATGLNEALGQATAVAIRAGAEAVLVLPTDLPLLDASDLEALQALCSVPPAVVIAPDRFLRGTNALLLTPPALIEYAFGDDSFSGHVARARAAGARLEICHRLGLRLDVDEPDDLKLAGFAEQGEAIIPGD
jgi:2-phospho-L-lactate guanylyltransferase